MAKKKDEIYPFTIIQDTREQQPWEFSKPKYTTVVKKLDTGDYTIEGLEDILCIERKKNMAEFSGNAVEKRFKDVVKRMEKFKYKYILLECRMADVMTFPKGSGIPSKRWKWLKITTRFLMHYISELRVKHGIHIIFCENAEYAKYEAINIMKRAYEECQDLVLKNKPITPTSS